MCSRRFRREGSRTPCRNVRQWTVTLPWEPWNAEPHPGRTHPLISWMVRHCCWPTAGSMCHQTVGRLTKCRETKATELGMPLGEVVWARVPTRLLRGKFEESWLELVWLGKTQHSDEHLRGDEHVVQKFRTIRRQPETARWRREDVDKLVGDSPKRKRTRRAGGVEPPLAPDGPRNDNRPERQPG